MVCKEIRHHRIIIYYTNFLSHAIHRFSGCGIFRVFRTFRGFTKDAFDDNPKSEFYRNTPDLFLELREEPVKPDCEDFV